jgi:preprotein translocase subunit SecG
MACNRALTTFVRVCCHVQFMSIILGILTFILIIVSLFLVLVVLAQPAKSDGSMGAALGGGMAESAFGGESSNVLSKWTINAAIAFFVLSFFLYLGNVYQRNHNRAATAGALPNIAVPVAPIAPISSAQPVAPVASKPAPAGAAAPAKPAPALPSTPPKNP